MSCESPGMQRDNTKAVGRKWWSAGHSFQKLEPQRVSKDANKLLDMMNKDYSGGSPSGANPRHKPPINNHESLDGRGG